MGEAGDLDRFQTEREAGIAAAVEDHFPALHEIHTTAYAPRTPEPANCRSSAASPCTTPPTPAPRS